MPEVVTKDVEGQLGNSVSAAKSNPAKLELEGDQLVAPAVIAQAAEEAAQAAEKASRIARIADDDLRFNQQRCKDAAAEAERQAARLSSSDVPGAEGYRHAARIAVKRAEKATKELPDSRQQKRRECPPLSDMRAAQWVIIITAALAAAIIIALLAVTYKDFSARQSDVDNKGFSNFRAADPSRLCINPAGDANLPVKRCEHLQWACHMNCTSTADNSTVPRVLVWDWHDYGEIPRYDENHMGESHDSHMDNRYTTDNKYRDLHFLLGAIKSPDCNMLESFTMSLTGQDMDQWAYTSEGGPAGFEHEDYSLIMNDQKYQDKAFYIFSTMMESDEAVANHAFYQRYDPKFPPIDIPYPEHDDVERFVQADNFNKSASVTLQLSFAYNASSSERPRVNNVGKAVPFFVRLNLRSGIAFDESNKGCFAAMLEASKSFPVPYFEDEGCDDKPVFCPTGHSSNRTEYQTFNNSAGCQDTVIPNAPLSVAACGRLELVTPNLLKGAPYAPCRPVLDPCTENNVSLSDLATLEAYVQAAKKDKTLQSSFFGRYDMSFDDLYGLYIGLLAGAVTAAVTALTSIVGLLVLYALRR